MSRLQTQLRRRPRVARTLLIRQRQALVLLGSFLIGMAMEWVRSLPVILNASWRVDTLVVLCAT